jgi:hypothetical protein
MEEELIPLAGTGRARPMSGIDAPDESERQAIARVSALPAMTWFELSHWAKETGNLQGWQRKIAFAVGARLKQGREPTRKQAIQAVKILDEATRLGYRGSEPSGSGGRR